MKENSVSNYRHGMEGTRTYQAWSSMKQRCLNQNAPRYPLYGGRGIKICDRWMSFEDFYADMGECQPGFSIERLNVNGNYEPSNCKWIPTHEQQRNKQGSVKVVVDGVEMGMKEACLKLGLNYRTVQSRVNILGWSKEESLGLCTNSAQSAGIEVKEAA